MRELHLYPEPQRGALVDSLTNSVKVETLTGFQNDTVKLCVHGGIRKRPPASLSTAPYIETAWSFDAMRASISVIDPVTKSTDVAPESGKFKLTVGDEQTDWLDWPEPAGDALTAAEITTFKAAVLTALNALTTVNNHLVAADPANAPVHTLSFAWDDTDTTTPIEVTGLRMIPPVDDEVGAVQSSPYVQYVKLTQLPIVIVDGFEFPDAPVAVIASERTGGAGVNAVQLLTIPDDGAFDLTGPGARTAVLSCAGLSAAILASALNATVLNGATNPSFAVTPRGTKTFAIEFIGPLAAASQADLGVTMRQAASSIVAEDVLPLTSKRFERALSGALTGTFRFELVIGGAENSFQADFVMTNDATGPGTVESAEEQLAVITKTETVYVPEDTLSPFVSLSAGFSYVPLDGLAEGTHQSIPHNLGTQDIDIVVIYADPASPFNGKKRKLKPGEYDFEAVTDDTAELWFAFELSDDEDADTYFGLFKVYVMALDATLQLLGGISITGDQVTIDGVSLTEVIALINAALGMIAGTVQVPAANIVNLIEGDQIDVSSLITQIDTGYDNSATVRNTFTKILRTAILNDPAFLTELMTAGLNLINNNADLRALFLSLMIEALSSVQASGIVNGIVNIPPFELTVPVPTTIDGPPKLVPQVVSEETTTTEGSVVTTRTLTHTEMVAVPSTIYLYGKMSRAKTSLSDGGTKSNVVLQPEDGVAGTYYTVSGANVKAAPVDGRPRADFADGDIITFADDHWYAVVSIGGVYYPAECERVFFTVAQDAKQFTAGSGWNIQFAPGFFIASDVGTTAGRVTLAVDTGVFSPSAASPHLTSITWTAAVGSIDLKLTNAPITVPGTVKVTRTADATFTGKIKLGNTEVTFTPTTADMAIRFRMTKFDLADADSAIGMFSGACKGATASLYTL